MFMEILTLAAAMLLVIAVLALIFVVTSCFRDLYEKADGAEYCMDQRRKDISELWDVFRELRKEFEDIKLPDSAGQPDTGE